MLSAGQYRSDQKMVITYHDTNKHLKILYNLFSFFCILYFFLIHFRPFPSEKTSFAFSLSLPSISLPSLSGRACALDEARNQLHLINYCVEIYPTNFVQSVVLLQII